MLKKILLGLVVALLALVGFIAARPSTFTVQRTLAMKAKPEYVFPFVNSFYRWADWSPWNYLDPEMKRTYEGPVVGVGSVYAWSGNDRVGEGRMTVEESRKNELVRIKLEFARPFATTGTTTLTLKPAGEGSEVTWAMEVRRDFTDKAASLFMDMGASLGKDLETGLATLRIEAEAKHEEKEEQKRLDDAVRKAMAEIGASPGYRPGKWPAPAPEK